MVEVCARVSDSVQPVHSWNDIQITDGRFAFSNAFAIDGIMAGGIAIADAMAAQNFMKLRRETPWLRKASLSGPCLRLSLVRALRLSGNFPCSSVNLRNVRFVGLHAACSINTVAIPVCAAMSVAGSCCQFTNKAPASLAAVSSAFCHRLCR